MGWIEVVLGGALVLIMAWEAFETIVLPRTVSRKLRFTSLYFEAVWKLGSVLMRIVGNRAALRESILGIVGPLTLIVLIAFWSSGIILGYAFIQYGLATPMTGGEHGLGITLYVSAATFFTLGYGDVVALNAAGRVVSMVEAGTGFGMLALVISYVPVLYQAFSARERVSLLLDARAGSPPVAAELLETYGDDLDGLRELFAEFERWGATLLETYLSYPILTMYRSQHEQLSWIASLTCICDACAFVQVSYQDESREMSRLKRQAQLTYAMLRHLVVDVAYILDEDPVEPPVPRMAPADWEVVSQRLRAKGAPVCQEAMSCTTLATLREDYEPYVYGLSLGVFLTMPPWMRPEHQRASWETTAWDEEKHF